MIVRPSAGFQFWPIFPVDRRRRAIIFRPTLSKGEKKLRLAEPMVYSSSLALADLGQLGEGFATCNRKKPAVWVARLCLADVTIGEQISGCRESRDGQNLQSLIQPSRRLQTTSG